MFKFGQVLANGAVVIEAKDNVVLAKWEREVTTPYVTWRFSPDDGATFWGHYHTNLLDAVQDFSTR